jgi:DNA polymerase III delta subunit
MPSKSPDAVKAIIAGSPYHIERLTTKITEALNKLGEVEYHSFFADEAEPEEIFTTIYTLSLFSDTKAVFIHRAELLKKDNNLFDLLKEPTDNSIIITIDDIKKAETLNKKLPGFTVHAEKAVSYEGGAKELIRIFAEKGLTINSDTAKRINSILDGDLSTAEQEAEKLSLYYAYRKDISNQDILNHLNGEPHEQIWAVIDSFMARKPDVCYKAFTMLPDWEAGASQIFYMLTMYLAGLYFKIVHPKLATKSNPIFNGKDYFMRSVGANIDRWNVSQVRDVIDTQRRLDVEIKTGQIAVLDAFLTLIHKLN